jgi:phosphatidylserine decarboxylase
LQKQMFTPYGYGSMKTVFLICFSLDAVSMFFPPEAQSAIVLVSSIFLVFALSFFRDPERSIPGDKRVILAPADGRIILVQQHEEKFTGGSSTLVSIFMSPFNVHVNRIPLNGKVTRLCYHPGRFLMAFDKRSMESNEKMEIGIDNGDITVLFTQVSGFLARRIVCTLSDGEYVQAGKRFGMIKFGSRVDIIFPASATVVAGKGMKTRAGETVLARY